MTRSRTIRFARRSLRPGCLGWAAAIGAAIVFVLWAAAPDIARWGIEYAGGRAGFAVRIEAVRLDLFRGAIGLHGVHVESKAPAILSRLRADDLEVRFSLRRLIADGIGGIESIRIESPQVELDPDSLRPSGPREGAPSPPPAIALPPIEITGGDLSVHTGERILRFAGIDLSLAGGAGRAHVAGVRVPDALLPARDAWLVRRLPVWIEIDRLDLASVAASRVELGAGETLRDLHLDWWGGTLRGSFRTGLLDGEAEVEAVLEGSALSFAVRARGLRSAAIRDAAPGLLPEAPPTAIVSIDARFRGSVRDPLKWRGQGTLAAASIAWREWRADRVEAAFEATEEGLSIRAAEALEGTTRATLAGTLSHGGDLRARIAFSADSLSSSPLARFIEELEGSATGWVRVEGPIDHPASWRGEADVALDAATWKTWRADRAHADVVLTDEGLRIRTAEVRDGDACVELAGIVSRDRWIDAEAEFRVGTIAASPVARILDDVDGAASGRVRLEGSIDDPETWRGGGEIDVGSPRWRTWSIDRIRAAFALSGEGLSILDAEAREGDSRADLAGFVARDGRIRARCEFSVPSIARCDPVRRIEGLKDAEGGISGSLRIDGRLADIDTVRVDGRLEAEHLRVREESIRRFDATWTLAGGGLDAGVSFSGPRAEGRASASATFRAPPPGARTEGAPIVAGFRSPLPGDVPRLSGAEIASLELDVAGETICLIDPIRIEEGGALDPFRLRMAEHTIHVEGRQGLADPEDPWVDLSIRSEGVDLARLEAAGLPIRRARGTAVARAHVTGPIREPWIEAEVELRDGQVAFEGLASPLQAIEGRVHLEGDRIRLDGVKGKYGGGTIELAGGASLSSPPIGSGAVSVADLDVRFQGKNLLLARTSEMLIRADADLRWKGPPDASQVSGVVRVARGVWRQEWRPTFRSRPIPRELFHLDDPILGPARLDIAFEPAGNLHLKNRLVDVRPEGRIVLRGTGAEPALSGTIETTTGTVTFAKAKLAIRSAVITVREGAPLDPAIDVRMDGEIAEYEITIGVTGTLDDPRVDLSSDPPLPKEQVLALMATGKPSPGGKEGAQAAALGLAAYFGPDIVEELFGIRTAAAGESSFLSRFSLESQSLREGDVYRLRFDLSKKFAVQAERGYYGDYNFDLLYRVWVR
ncbi:MAG: translocation/assembly module TamB domain-containing protein [Planctomycetes bacterium]|nr:translocation/assembly module TamB domain-containing protein [Planctomycetota bacterium]